MSSESHNFHSYFVLVKNTKNKENVIAVYLSCINYCDEVVREVFSLPISKDKGKKKEIIEVSNKDDDDIFQLAKKRKLFASTVLSFNSSGNQQ
ncbi:4255_t:CDS:2 [Funneliformis caledonium]|uniref:4255_t:CDS:1 n=1 Tax=Funneliformis caledonium TaxID=1117310 RepID=A0A9N9H8J1_9GLOM|nr:4255_t:CDS:2 [Funneliformis caledonium]